MITIKNVRTLGGKVEDITVEGSIEEVIDAERKLTMLPGLIDTHVHFRTPGQEHKENWETGAQAAIAGGITTVFDMPNNTPSCVDLKSLQAKRALIDEQLSCVDIPLRYQLYLGADKDHLKTIGQTKELIAAIKIYMGSTTGGLIMSDQKDLHRVFQVAAQENIMVSVHAEDESILQKMRRTYANETDPAVHSKIRDRTAAIKATEQAIALAEEYDTQLLIHHVSTKEELDLIHDAKKNHILVYAETSPHHLFLNEDDYAQWGTKIQVNPPVRTKEDQEALWEAIHDGTIDIIGSDHAPHTLEDKNQPYGKAPSGFPGIETMLPLLLNAANEKKLSLEDIVKLMRINPETIFNLPHNQDIVLVDMEMVKEVRDENMKTKCGWSPYSGRVLKGWPVYTIVKGQLYKVG